MLCLKGKWERGSVLLKTIIAHSRMFQMRAETCKDFQEAVLHNATDSLDKK